MIDLSFSGASLTHKVDFRRATFEGVYDLYDIEVPEGADFSGCRVVGRLNISLHVRADLNFEHARIDENGWLDIDTYSIAPGVELLLNDSQIGCRLELKYAVSEESQGLIAMNRLQIDLGMRLSTSPHFRSRRESQSPILMFLGLAPRCGRP
ncbi:MAG: pentapeptide repeat-containing protein [Pseudonocardiales bacterium]|nr:pentapeptide repeat-containing protein [Pseudonocardiales bacterium]